MRGSPNLLILGAGASYGSEVNKSVAPPLAADLFDELLAFDPSLWRQVPDDIAGRFRADFEAGMLEFYGRFPHDTTKLQRSMAAFFYRFAPTSNSLYHRLSQNIKLTGWQGAIVTLNYERMLLLALCREGVHPVCNVENASSGQIEVCLLHGCCNIFCDAVEGAAGAVLMDARAVETNGNIICLDHPDAFWSRIRNDAFPQVMSYFEPSKFTTSGANFIEEQRHRLVELVSGASFIAIVGAQVRLSVRRSER